jgi:hypothetical protein
MPQGKVNNPQGRNQYDGISKSPNRGSLQIQGGFSKEYLSNLKEKRSSEEKKEALEVAKSFGKMTAASGAIVAGGVVSGAAGALKGAAFGGLPGAAVGMVAGVGAYTAGLYKTGVAQKMEDMKKPYNNLVQNTKDRDAAYIRALSKF